MRTLLTILLAGLGAASVLIGAGILLLGAEAIASQGTGLFNALTGTDIASPAWPPTMDSELRFYAALFVAFGLLCVRSARAPERHAAEIPWLMLAFFAGGVGRALSCVMVGAPHPFFLMLMWIELVMPVVVIGIWRLTTRAG